jgi:hypothetical protein
MLRFPIFASALVLGLPLAHAGTLPVFDMEAICLDLAATSAKQELVVRGCVDFQERTRNELAQSWDTVPVRVRDQCVKAAGENGDYWRLKSCIDNAGSVETAAASTR